MHLSLRLAILLLTCTPIAAQAIEDPTKAIAELQKEKERLQREIDFVKGRVADSRQTLRNLGHQSLSFRTIDAGRSAATPPTTPPVARRPARLMQDDERQAYPHDTMVVVNGNPIRQGQFDELVSYQAGVGTDDAARAMHSMIALADLIRIENIVSSFAESEATVHIAEALSEMEGGRAIGELAKSLGTIRGAAEDGAVEITRHSPHGVKLERIAFTTPAGTRSKPFAHYTGLAVIQVDSAEKGSTPELDKVHAHVVVAPFAEGENLAKADSMLASGQVEIVVRDREVMRMLPAAFQDAEEVQAARTKNTAEDLAKAVAEMEKEIARIRESKNADEQARLEGLEKRLEKMRMRLETMQKEAQAEGGTPPEKKG
ncbi:MAG: hypothetical protein JNK78_12720 [Planctomycetes bacterium]|nr:hypothetical protein [Planctomycetota bacterium]